MGIEGDYVRWLKYGQNILKMKFSFSFMRLVVENH